MPLGTSSFFNCKTSRELKFWKGPFSAHLEYNGGLSKGMSYKNAYLAGATYTFNNASFSKTKSLILRLKALHSNRNGTIP